MASKKKQQNLFSDTANKLAAYEQKQLQHQKDSKRKGKDNRIAAVIGVAALAVAVAAQFGYSALYPTKDEAATPSASPSAIETVSPNVPSKDIAENRVWTGTMKVNDANLDIEIFGDKAPQAAANFIALASKGFYNEVPCHRITTDGIYILQCGDPTGTGTGGPGYSFGPIENPPVADSSGVATYTTGLLAMANSGTPDSNGSQFFIVYKDSPLSPSYTVFGRVTGNLEGLKPIIDGGIGDGSSPSQGGKPAVETKLGAIVLN
ncbi:MAG: hypothetical protein RLZZ340_833 [Actinomycetota bacterium]